MKTAIPPVKLRAVAEGWQLRGACHRSAQPDLWFPGPGEPTEPAKRVCRGCPVRLDCLIVALRRETSDDQVHGVWGGYAAQQRRQLRRCLAARCDHADPAECMEEVERL